LSAALQMIEENGNGALVFIQQEEKQIGLIEKLQAYNNGGAKKGQPKMDNKDYGIGAQILRDLNIQNLKLITNNTAMNTSVINAYGLEVAEIVPFTK
jgi:3,4-dihydroxy 2-butanone 4-phosphate synthase/GTP cyclohydrolase II